MDDVVLVINSGGRRDAEWLDEVTGELHTDLSEIGGLQVSRVTTAAADGQKSGAVEQIGQLLVSSGAIGAVVWSIRDVSLKFLERTKADSITIKKGDREVTIVRPGLAQVDNAIEKFGDLLADE
ncbi:hypothetical protein [Nocardia rhizosphaerihabitans]|uniref:Uncharacterized protein n=1 Tax=Nocardia rhizosphaerihabitans TaxID=1691570 RepID=A0ABQ2L0Y4_9NOCA|nr:hypothetical protein [Nocardia rhizosphaerihabitans]GGN99006.1 hypothetical protein GCM10011610_66490 [Nocardia rhizosphaerihabitans]